jgi:eukaryotic-like serine/threonine-protein kinase
MTPDETSLVPVDERLLAEVLACDALLHTGSTAEYPEITAFPSAVGEHDRARRRLLLLLRMVDAAEAPTGSRADAGAEEDRGALDADRPLLGRFEVVEDLGSGGFGFVIRARDRLLGREVALKMPLPERVLAPGDVDRFLREARAAARLDHPHIVRVFDAGELGPLGYFIASEFCPGPNLRRWLKSRNQPVPAGLAARWMAAIADAVQHAHDRGILHRDIKPDNVILTGASATESVIPRLTDFGLAKFDEEGGNETRSEARLGTPHYMAPEQAAGRRGEVGPATDVYALGATLYEILTGRPPLRGETDAETLRLILESEPVAPRSLRPGLPRDLETICLKCLHKEPARRYGTAAGLHDDLRRFLEGRPIRARRTSAAERALQWCRRNTAVAGLMVAVFVLLAAVAGVASVGYVREAAARALAEAAEGKAEGEADRAHAAEHEIRRQWYAASVNLMQPAWDAGHIGRLRELLTATQGYHDRGFEWYYWRRLCHLERSDLIGHRASVRSVAWSPDGARLATASWDGTARVWDAGGREMLSLHGHQGQVNSVAWSPDGTRLATAGWDGTARIWDAARGRALRRLDGHTGRVWSVTWSPAGTWLATGGEDATARIWDAFGGCERLVLKGHAGDVVCTAWSPDGTLLATGSADGSARIWDLSNGREPLILDGPAGWVNSVAWSPDGTRLATGGRDGRVKVWEAASGREVLVLEGHAGWIHCVTWSPDGKLLATGNSDGTARVWDAAIGRELLILKGHPCQVNCLSWSPDGTLLAVGSADGTSKLWYAAVGREPLAFKGHRSKVNSVAWSPDGTRLATASWDGTAKVWDTAGGREPLTLTGPASEVWSVAWSPDGTRLATGNSDGMARIWDAADGRALRALKGHTSRIISVAWSPDGTRLATASWDGTARVWDATVGRELLAMTGHTSEVWSVAWSPDGTRLATGTRNGTVWVWHAAIGRELLVFKAHARRVISVAWSPDGTRLATGGEDGTARVWDAADGREVLALTGHMGEIRSLSWSPDGMRLASGSADGTAKVWDTAGGRELLTVTGHTGFTRSVAWSPDGRRLATAGDDGAARAWDAAGDEGEVQRWDRQARAERDVPARDAFRGPQAQGFLGDWLLLLPLPLASGEGGARALDRQQVPDEASLRPTPGERVPSVGGGLVWREYRSPGAVLDFNAVLGRATELGVVYAVCYIESDRAREDLCLQIGSDDQAKVYLNGRQIYQCPVPRPLETLDTIGPVLLKPGTNVLVLKVVNETANWEGCARLVDDAGRPPEGIRAKLTP